MHCHIAWDCPLTSSVGIELLNSSARVTSGKSAKGLLTDLETLGPIDRTPGIPGSDKNTRFTQQKIGIQILLAALNAKTKQTNID